LLSHIGDGDIGKAQARICLLLKMFRVPENRSERGVGQVMSIPIPK
jgi:hypothetical protein